MNHVGLNHGKPVAGGAGIGDRFAVACQPFRSLPAFALAGQSF
jgi:hypothetical protein